MSSESSVFSGEPTTFSSASIDTASETSSATTTEIITPTSTTEQDTSQTETFNTTTQTETINSSPAEPQSAPPTSPVSDTASTPSSPTTGLSSNDASSSTNTSLVDSETVVPTDVSNTTPNSSTSADSTEADPTSITPSAVPTEVTTTAPVNPTTETSVDSPPADPTSATSQPTSLPPSDPTTDPTIASTTDPSTIPPTGTTNVPPTDPTTTILTDSTTAEPTEPSTAPPTDSTTTPPTDTLTTESTDPATVDTATTTDPTGSTVVSTDPTDTTSPPTETTTTEPTDPGTVVTVDSTGGSTTPPSDPTAVPTDTGLESVPVSTSSPVNTSTPRGATTRSGDVAQQTAATTSPTAGRTTSVVLTSVGTSTGTPVSTAIPASGTGGTLTVGSGITEGGTLTVSGSAVRETIDPHTEANVSEFAILTQSAPERINAPSETVVTYVTTEFTTTTNSDGSVSVIPTKTSTVVGTITPTYSVQPNEFERNKGPILGLSIVAGILLLIAIAIGIWVCRRRRRQVVGRHHNPSPIGDVVTGPVLIRGHSLPVEGSWEWRPPLVTEVGDDDHEDDVQVLAGQMPMNAMTEREGSRPSIPAPLMRANSYGSAEEGIRPPLDVEISSVGRSTESSRDTMQFTTSLLSFDTDPITPQIVTSRFSDTSSSQSGPRTASLISLSAEPTPLDGRFSMSSISIPESSGTIPVISPFADSFSTEAARNSYWQNSSRSSRTSSASSHESGPIRFNSSDQQCGWREVEMEDDLPSRMRGGRASTQDIVYQASDPFEDENTPSLMSQVSLISAQSPRNSASSLLNPPLRPQWTGTLSSLGQRSGPSKAPSLPPIPAVASPALTDDSFHAEGLLADPAYAQSRSGGLDDPQRPGFSTHDSFSSLLDHVDYSMPITSNVNPFDDEITFSKLTRSEESSMCSETPESQPQNDFLNDVLPVLSVLQKRAQTSREALQTQ